MIQANSRTASAMAPKGKVPSANQPTHGHAVKRLAEIDAVK